MANIEEPVICCSFCVFDIDIENRISQSFSKKICRFEREQSDDVASDTEENVLNPYQDF